MVQCSDQIPKKRKNSKSMTYTNVARRTRTKHSKLELKPRVRPY